MITVKVRGLEQVKKFISDLPRGLRGVATEAAAEYLIGNNNRGLRHYPGYKYVSRKAAYGQTFKSDKQRRWFWANGGPDMIGNNRTGETSSAWTMTGNGTKVRITNSSQGAKWTMSDKYQARQPDKVGWRKVKEIIQTNYKGMIQAASRAVSKYIKERRHG